MVEAVRVRGLAKHYRDIAAVRGIDLAVSPGETFGFLGPNGAGKSTTINMLCTLITPTAGTATVAGYDVVTARDQVRQQIGLVFQESTLDNYLTAERNLRFHAELYGMSRADTLRRIPEVMEIVGLWERRRSLVGTFSGGMKRRLELARGLLHAPRVLFLDEPTVGLDPQTRTSIWNYIDELKRATKVTIFMTTHYMEEAEFCDRIAIIDHGKIVVEGTPESLKASVGEDRVRIHTADDQAAIAALKDRFQVTASLRDGAVSFPVRSGPQFVPRLFAELAVPIHAVSVAQPSLDDVFLAYTGTTIREAEASGTDDLRRLARRGR